MNLNISTDDPSLADDRDTQRPDGSRRILPRTPTGATYRTAFTPEPTYDEGRSDVSEPNTAEDEEDNHEEDNHDEHSHVDSPQTPAALIADELALDPDMESIVRAAGPVAQPPSLDVIHVMKGLLALRYTKIPLNRNAPPCTEPADFLLARFRQELEPSRACWTEEGYAAGAPQQPYW